MGRHARVRIEQGLGSQDVGVYERRRIHDRPVDVRLRRDVDHRVHALDQLVDELAVSDVADDEGHPRITRDGVEVGAYAGVGECVEDSHRLRVRLTSTGCGLKRRHRA